MRESIWGYAVIILGIIAVAIIWFFANVTKTDQHNYNLLKETVESAMMDSVDLAEYRNSGKVTIEEQKFVENFIRRFAENADLSNTYKIEIYDISTNPPKVSLRVSSAQSTTSTGEIMTFNIVNNIDAILESEYLKGDETILTHVSNPGFNTNQDGTLRSTRFSHRVQMPNVSGKCFYLDRIENVRLDVRLDDYEEYCKNINYWYATSDSCKKRVVMPDNILEEVTLAEIEKMDEKAEYVLTWDVDVGDNKCLEVDTSKGTRNCEQIFFKYDVVWKETACD